ncbi:MAG: ABC transporter substrate-binding protein [Pseudomonadota bacterium]|jgi:ABC-type branched-subunit amino acid transport system substrate-binding protein
MLNFLKITRQQAAGSAIALAFMATSLGVAKAENKVGVLASYTGEWGAYGQAYQIGIELADVGKSTTFIYEEDGFLPAKSVAAFRKLVQHDKITAAIVGDTVTAQAVSPIAQKLKLPLFVWASSDGIFAQNPYALRLWSSSTKDLGFAADEVSRRGYKKLALFITTHTYSTQWAEELALRFPGSRVHEFPAAPDSFATQLIKAKSSGFDAIGICLGAGMNGRLARQSRELGIGLPIFGCNFLEGTAEIRAAGDALDKVWFTAPKISPEFVSRYKQRTGVTDHVVSAATFHDAALLLTGRVDKPFAINGLREVNENGDRHLDFNFEVFTFRGVEIVTP